MKASRAPPLRPLNNGARAKPSAPSMSTQFRQSSSSPPLPELPPRPRPRPRPLLSPSSSSLSAVVVRGEGGGVAVVVGVRVGSGPRSGRRARADRRELVRESSTFGDGGSDRVARDDVGRVADRGGGEEAEEAGENEYEQVAHGQWGTVKVASSSRSGAGVPRAGSRISARAPPSARVRSEAGHPSAGRASARSPGRARCRPAPPCLRFRGQIARTERLLRPRRARGRRRGRRGTPALLPGRTRW